MATVPRLLKLNTVTKACSETGLRPEAEEEEEEEEEEEDVLCRQNCVA